MTTTKTINNNIVTEVFEATTREEVFSLTNLMLANEYSIVKFVAYSSDFANYDTVSLHCPKFQGDGKYQTELVNDFGKALRVDTYDDILDLLVDIDKNYDCLKVTIAYALNELEVNSKDSTKEVPKMKTKIYAIAPVNKAFNDFCEKNADRYEIINVDKFAQNMQNTLVASYVFSDEVATQMYKRLKFASFRPSTAYRVMWLDLRSGKVIRFHNAEEVKAQSIVAKTQFANYAFDKASQEILTETEQWLQVYAQLTKQAYDSVANDWQMRRDYILNRIGLYMQDCQMDTYNAGHLVPTMKKNIHTFSQDYRFFDLQFKKGDTTFHEEERETEHYEVTDLELLKNFCHAVVCKRYGIDLDDSIGNGGRVSRECNEDTNLVAEVARVLKAMPASESQWYIEGIQNGTLTVEDIALMLGITELEFEEVVVEYREF